MQEETTLSMINLAVSWRQAGISWKKAQKLMAAAGYASFEEDGLIDVATSQYFEFKAAWQLLEEED